MNGLSELVRIGSIIIFHLSKLSKAKFFIVWCYIYGEASGEIWNWSLLGGKCWQAAWSLLCTWRNLVTWGNVISKWICGMFRALTTREDDQAQGTGLVGPMSTRIRICSKTVIFFSSATATVHTQPACLYSLIRVEMRLYDRNTKSQITYRNHYAWTQIFSMRRKNLRFRKCIGPCGQGLRWSQKPTFKHLALCMLTQNKPNVPETIMIIKLLLL